MNKTQLTTKPDATDLEQKEREQLNEWSRREFVRNAGLLGLGSLLLGSIPYRAFASPYQKGVSLPPLVYSMNLAGDTVTCPFGTMKFIFKNGVLLPTTVTAPDKSTINFAQRVPGVKIGNDLTGLSFTLKEIVLPGTKLPVKWSSSSIKNLIAALSADKAKARAIMHLRASLSTAYPFAIVKKKAKGSTNSKPLAVIQRNASKKSGAEFGKCETTTITDTVVTEVMGWIDHVVSAAQQWEACYDRQVSSGDCSGLVSPFKETCAAGFCTAEGFVDVMTSLWGVVDTITEEVVRTVVTCTKPFVGLWPSPASLITGLEQVGGMVVGGIAQPALNITKTTVDQALKVAKTIIAPFAGVMGNCLVNGEWSLAQVQTPIDLGGGKLAVPYGVKVCITTACAQSICSLDVASEFASSLGATLSLLVLTSPEFAALLGPTVVATLPAVAPAVAALIAGLSPEILLALTAILCMILILLYWGIAVTVGCCIALQFPANLTDGKICIEHPTIALALIGISLMATAPTAPIGLVPPIVTG